jgi:hypothetical protein
MAIVSKFWAEKLPEAVEEDARVENAVDFSQVFTYLVNKGRIWDGKGEVVRYYRDCNDVPGANVVKVRGEGWFAVK